MATGNVKKDDICSGAAVFKIYYDIVYQGDPTTLSSKKKIKQFAVNQSTYISIL